jgi:hypothetical protein
MIAAWRPDVLAEQLTRECEQADMEHGPCTWTRCPIQPGGAE